MNLSPETKSFITQLQEFSQQKIQRPTDLATLLELSRTSNLQHILDELTFIAKFVSNTFVVMKRIGVDADGYDTLSIEFKDKFEKASSLAQQIVLHAPDDVRQYLTTTYFELNGETMGNFMQLLHDLAWVKNWTIDRPKNI